MMFPSFRDLVGVDLIAFEDFAQCLCGVDQRKFLDMGYKGKAPPCFRIGHGRPYWDKTTIEQWIKDEYQRQTVPRNGSRARRSAPIIMPPRSARPAQQEEES